MYAALSSALLLSAENKQPVDIHWCQQQQQQQQYWRLAL